MVGAAGALARVLVEVDTSDCERVRDGVLAQPVNAWTSLAYVVAGAWVVGRSLSAPAVAARPAVARVPLAFGALLALAGVGSVLYHGGDGEVSRWLHDASFLWVLVFVAVHDWPPAGVWDRARRNAALAAGLGVGVLTVVPVLTNVALVAVTAVIGWVEGRAWAHRPEGSRRLLGWAAGLLVVAVAVYLLSRTGAPLCDPDGGWQGHGLWHVLTASAFAVWGEAAFRSSRGGRPA